MSSQMGHVGGARRTLYCASKWAVEGLSKAMALDLAPHKIRVNTIAPTFIETAMTAPFFQDETFKSQVLSKIKLARDRKSTRLNSQSLMRISYAVFCLKKKKRI